MIVDEEDEPTHKTLNKNNNSWFWDFDENDNKENKSTHHSIL